MVDSGKININSFNNKINYAVDFATLRYNNNTFYTSSLKGDLANDSLLIIALTKDNKNNNQFGIGASVIAKEKTYSLSLKNDLLVNYQKWNVSPNNNITYSPLGIVVRNFLIENGTTKIAANSKEDIANSPIDIDIVNFDIKTIDIDRLKFHAQRYPNFLKGDVVDGYNVPISVN